METHNCHTNADCIDEGVGFKCRFGVQKTFPQQDDVSKKVKLRVKSVIINPLFDGNHICASAGNDDIVVNCTNLVPTGNDYCVIIDETGLSAEEIKWIRAKAAVGDTGCPGYSCECDSGNYRGNAELQ